MRFSETLVAAIQQINSDIAPDLDLSDVPEEDQLLCVAEACLDAGRLEMFGFAEADAEYRALLREHGWPAVVAEAAKYVSL